jgi:hypothetical protein
MLQLEGKKINSDVIASSWDAFGNYIARQLRFGKGVSIPKFGNFTFSAVDVNLAVN